MHHASRHDAIQELISTLALAKAKAECLELSVLAYLIDMALDEAQHEAEIDGKMSG